MSLYYGPVKIKLKVDIKLRSHTTWAPSCAQFHKEYIKSGDNDFYPWIYTTDLTEAEFSRSQVLFAHRIQLRRPYSILGFDANAHLYAEICVISAWALLAYNMLITIRIGINSMGLLAILSAVHEDFIQAIHRRITVHVERHASKDRNEYLLDASNIVHADVNQYCRPDKVTISIHFHTNVASVQCAFGSITDSVYFYISGPICAPTCAPPST